MPPRTVAVISPVSIIFFNMIFTFYWGAMPRMLPFYARRLVEMLNLVVSHLKVLCGATDIVMMFADGVRRQKIRCMEAVTRKS